MWAQAPSALARALSPETHSLSLCTFRRFTPVLSVCTFVCLCLPLSKRPIESPLPLTHVSPAVPLRPPSPSAVSVFLWMGPSGSHEGVQIRRECQPAADCFHPPAFAVTLFLWGDERGWPRTLTMSETKQKQWPSFFPVLNETVSQAECSDSHTSGAL